MTYQAIAGKFRRALRNGHGATFTPDQLRNMAEVGILKFLAELESDELCRNQSLNTADAGLPSVETEKRPTSGRSLDASEAQSFIDQLGYAMSKPQKAR